VSQLTVPSCTARKVAGEAIQGASRKVAVIATFHFRKLLAERAAMRVCASRELHPFLRQTRFWTRARDDQPVLLEELAEHPSFSSPDGRFRLVRMARRCGAQVDEACAPLVRPLPRVRRKGRRAEAHAKEGVQVSCGGRCCQMTIVT
jgi:hypothetical protein